MFVEHLIDFHDVGLNVAQGPPAGPPLLLLHGVLRRWTDFGPLLPWLAQRWEVTGLDFRGHGESGFTPNQYRVVDYVEDALAVVREYLSEPAVIYGHSLGAMVAAAVASEAPQHVRGLVLEDPPLETMGSRIRETPFHSQFVGIQAALASDVPVSELASALAEIPIRWPDTGQVRRLGDLRDGSSLRYSASCLKQIDAEVLDPIVEGRWLEGYDWPKVFAGIACPTLLLQGDPAAGGMLAHDDADRIGQLVRDCIRIRFPQIGHLIHWMATEATIRVVAPFLETVR